MILYYVRHGEPIYDPDSLTPLGHKQAEALAIRMRELNIDRIYASTSTRAIQTAEPTARAIGKDIIPLDFCNEMYAWDELASTDDSGMKTWCFNIDKIRGLFLTPEIALNDKWYDSPAFENFKFKHGIERINKCVDEWLLGLGYEHDRKSRTYKAVSETEEAIALFAHQGFGLAFLSSLLDIPYPLFSMHFDLRHSNVTKIEFKEKNGTVVPVVTTLSNDGHLYARGLSK